MKRLRYILVPLLAFMVFFLGAGFGMVHICSVYCKTQMCSSSLHKCGTSGEGGDCCGHDKASWSGSTGMEISETCSCLNLSYNIDFFKLSNDDDAPDYAPVVIDVLEVFSYRFYSNTISLSDDNAINAPPLSMEGRRLLALHSILII